MAITTESLRAKWELARSNTIGLGTPLPLRDFLSAKVVSAETLNSNGTLAQLDVNGRKSMMSAYGPGSITATEVRDSWVTLLDYFDLAFNYQVANALDSSDLAVWNFVKSNYLVKATESYQDFTGLRMPNPMGVPTW